MTLFGAARDWWEPFELEMAIFAFVDKESWKCFNKDVMEPMLDFQDIFMWYIHIDPVNSERAQPIESPLGPVESPLGPFEPMWAHWAHWAHLDPFGHINPWIWSPFRHYVGCNMRAHVDLHIWALWWAHTGWHICNMDRIGETIINILFKMLWPPAQARGRVFAWIQTGPRWTWALQYTYIYIYILGRSAQNCNTSTAPHAKWQQQNIQFTRNQCSLGLDDLDCLFGHGHCFEIWPLRPHTLKCIHGRVHGHRHSPPPAMVMNTSCCEQFPSDPKAPQNPFFTLIWGIWAYVYVLRMDGSTWPLKTSQEAILGPSVTPPAPLYQMKPKSRGSFRILVQQTKIYLSHSNCQKRYLGLPVSAQLGRPLKLYLIGGVWGGGVPPARGPRVFFWLSKMFLDHIYTDDISYHI